MYTDSTQSEAGQALQRQRLEKRIDKIMSKIEKEANGKQQVRQEN